MIDERGNDNFGDQDDRNRQKPTRKKKNIQFARSLGSMELNAILQNALMEARGESSNSCTLMVELVHEIKYRLRWYYEHHGEAKHNDE